MHNMFITHNFSINFLKPYHNINERRVWLSGYFQHSLSSELFWYFFPFFVWNKVFSLITLVYDLFPSTFEKRFQKTLLGKSTNKLLLKIWETAVTSLFWLHSWAQVPLKKSLKCFSENHNSFHFTFPGMWMLCCVHVYMCVCCCCYAIIHWVQICTCVWITLFQNILFHLISWFELISSVHLTLSTDSGWNSLWNRSFLWVMGWCISKRQLLLPHVSRAWAVHSTLCKQVSTFRWTTVTTRGEWLTSCNSWLLHALILFNHTT